MLYKSQNHYKTTKQIFKEFSKAVSPKEILFASPNVKLPSMGSSAAPNHEFHYLPATDIRKLREFLQKTKNGK